jgi:hypothetical protein
MGDKNWSSALEINSEESSKVCGDGSDNENGCMVEGD